MVANPYKWLAGEDPEDETYNMDSNRFNSRKICFQCLNKEPTQTIFFLVLLCAAPVLIVISGIKATDACDPVNLIFNMPWEYAVLLDGMINFFGVLVLWMMLYWFGDEHRYIVVKFSFLMFLCVDIFFIVWEAILLANTDVLCTHTGMFIGQAFVAYFEKLTFLFLFYIIVMSSDNE